MNMLEFIRQGVASTLVLAYLLHQINQTQHKLISQFGGWRQAALFWELAAAP